MVIDSIEFEARLRHSPTLKPFPNKHVCGILFFFLAPALTMPAQSVPE